MNLKDTKRLSKTLAAAGVASRRACEELIFAGRVSVNGKVIKIPQSPVHPEDIIQVDGKTIQVEEKKYFILNKPAGYLCTAKRMGKSKIVLDLFQDIKERLFTVGRLDKDTEGLILVTNDGHFAQKVIHPSSDIHKEYLVKTDQDITAEHLKAISTGTLVEGVYVKPVRLSKIRKGTLKIVISEGKKREVRLLLEAAGLKTKSLSRIRIGSLQMGPLPVGQWREMTKREMDLIFE